MDEIRMEDVSPEYAAFVEKFKPKKTTDDCYTPENIFDAVADGACREYGFARDVIVRPFWPGGDYKRHEYPDGCVVVDNPPFSILSEICRFYEARKIKFFLFAPALSCMGSERDVCYVFCDADITYENGASVRTAFITNLEPDMRMRTAPELGRILKAENGKNLQTKKLPRYSYPPEVMTAANMQRLSRYGIDLRIPRRAAFYIKRLDSQIRAGKSIYGNAYLLSRQCTAEHIRAEAEAAKRAEAEAAATHVWALSPDELRLIDELSKEDTNE